MSSDDFSRGPAQSAILSKIAKLEQEAVARRRGKASDESSCSSSSNIEHDEELSSDVSVLRKAPGHDAQPDFFIPTLYDVGTKDSRGIMDVAVFRLSKKDKRPQSIIRYDLPDGHVEVSSGIHGMASVWDYDIVLMAISHLTESMNRFREGKGAKPGPEFRPHVSDVLKFCRRDNGGKQKDAIVGALERLSTTHVSIERTKKVKNKTLVINEGENLIGPYRTVTNKDTGKLESVEIRIADWMYREITEGKNPDVLTVHPNYFLIEPGIGRFLYRLARKAAGKTSATWGFKTIYDRSGSTGTMKEFCRILRGIISKNDLPEYSLKEEQGKDGPMLVMTNLAYTAEATEKAEP